MRGATTDKAGSEPAPPTANKTWKSKLPFWRRPAAAEAPARSTRTPITTVEAPDHYTMSFGSRMLLSAPIILIGLLGLWALVFLCWPHHEAIWQRIANFFGAAICGLLIWLSSRRLGHIVMSAVIDTTEVRFRQWNRKTLVVPKRGRVLKKTPSAAENPLLELKPVEGDDFIFIFRHDKAAMAFLSGLERRGILRGPGGARLQNPLTPR
ncbi:MAG TPA: hypothetical protein VFJ58_15440 [Armatimonadota bacterium]|nr:hypothetical protein [Armatimonadota bacterium]